MAIIKSTLGKATMYAPIAVAAVEAAQKLWETINKDDKFVAQVALRREQLAAMRAERSPQAKLDRAITIIDDAIGHATPGNDAERAQHAAWLAEAASMRQAAAVVHGYSPSRQKAATKRLQARADALIDDILAATVGPELLEAPKPRRLSRRKGKRAQA